MEIFTNISIVLFGLFLLLFGMTIMSNGLKTAAGKKLKGIIQSFTKNRFLGVLVGSIVTMIIQSSSATTVMVVGFVNSGVMTLSQAAPIIMGANIGTTITGQIMALNLTDYAPTIIMIGLILKIFSIKKKNKEGKSSLMQRVFAGIKGGKT